MEDMGWWRIRRINCLRVHGRVQDRVLGRIWFKIIVHSKNLINKFDIICF